MLIHFIILKSKAAQLSKSAQAVKNATKLRTWPVIKMAFVTAKKLVYIGMKKAKLAVNISNYLNDFTSCSHHHIDYILQY